MTTPSPDTARPWLRHYDYWVRSNLSYPGRSLSEIMNLAAIERPDGRVVDFLLDHGVVVYPVNPKALDRARDRFRQSGAKSDPFDARVLADGADAVVVAQRDLDGDPR